MAVREIVKVLGGMEDLATGVGKEEQLRAGATVQVGKIDIPYALESEQEIADLDVAAYEYSRLGDVEYRYYNGAVKGDIKSNVGPGYWIVGGNTDYAQQQAHAGDMQLLGGGKAFPLDSTKSLTNGDDVTPAGFVRNAITGMLYETFVAGVKTEVSGEATGIDFIDKRGTIGAVPVDFIDVSIRKKVLALSKLPGGSPDEQLATALQVMKNDPYYQLIIDGNFSFFDNYTIDHYVDIVSALNNGSMRFAGTGEFLRLKKGSDGSRISDLNVNGNDFNGNPFNGKTLLSVRADDANDMSQIVQSLNFNNLRFEWCDLALFLGHAGSSSFDNLRAINVVKGVRLFGVCLENSFYRPNILAHRYAVEFLRNSTTVPQGSGDVPQGNYFTGGTLVLQGADALRTYGGFTDATINTDTATIKADCLFDYGFANVWIENNLRHSSDNTAYLGYIIDYVQNDVPKYFQGAIGISRCRLIGNKVRLSGGTASSYAEGGTQGTVITGCDIALFRDTSGNFGFDINNYTSNVSVKVNTITVKSGNKRIATFNKVRDVFFTGNTVIYEDDIANVYPTGPTVASESPIFLVNTERAHVKNNDFDYATSNYVDFVAMQGTNTDFEILGNSSPLDGLSHVAGDLRFYRKHGKVKVLFKTTTAAYNNGDTVTTLPDWLVIKNAEERIFQQSAEYNVYGANVATYNRLVYASDDTIKFFGTGVDEMRCVFSYDIF